MGFLFFFCLCTGKKLAFCFIDEELLNISRNRSFLAVAGPFLPALDICPQSKSIPVSPIPSHLKKKFETQID